MADNIPFSPGAGPGKVATDEAPSNGETAHHQKIKLVFGSDGAASDVTQSSPFPTKDAAVGDPADAAWNGSGSGNLIAIVKSVWALLNAGLTLSGVTSIGLNNGEGVKGAFGGITDNPGQQFSRPANTTPYTAGDLIANSATAGSVTFGTITAARVAAGSFQIPRMRLSSNSANLGNVAVRARLWSAAAPQYNGGDNAPYSASPGVTAANYLGSYTGVFEVFSDKSTAILTPDYGPALVKLGSGQVIFWDVQTLSDFTPSSGAFFAITAETLQD